MRNTVEEVSGIGNPPVEPSNVALGRVEFVHRRDDVPMGSAPSTVVPAVPDRVGRGTTVVRFQPAEVDALPGADGMDRGDVAVTKRVDEGRPCEQGVLVPDVAFAQGARLVSLRMGLAETVERPSTEPVKTVTVVGMYTTSQELWPTVTVLTSVTVTVLVDIWRKVLSP